jgi:magnesium chelatase family protein
MEEKHITISRAAHQVRFPAKFQLVVAMNPCPCGYFSDSRSNCNCTFDQIKRYRTRISGLFLDRLDLWFTVPTLPKNILTGSRSVRETSIAVKARVIQARLFAMSSRGKSNAELTNKEVEKFCSLAPKD